MIPENIKTRLFPNGKLKKQMNFMKQVVHDNPESEYAKSMLNSLKVKFWSGSNKIKYSSLLNEAWIKFVSDQTGDIIEIDGLKFINDDLLKSEYTDIFLSKDFYIYPIIGRGSSIEKKVLSMLNVEGSYENYNVEIRNDDIIIDAGANLGLFSLYAVKHGAKKVFAFEPQKEAIQFLKMNIELNNVSEYIHIIPLGLNDKSEDLELIRPKSAHAAASIVLRYNGNNESQTINCVDLDSWISDNNIPRIDFIKADIEGAERKMLQGATRVLKEFAPRLAVCTYHLPDDPEVLERIILKANPKYIIKHTSHKLFAFIP